MREPSYWHLEGFMREPSVLHPDDLRVLSLLVQAVANYQKPRPITEPSVLAVVNQLGPLQPGEIALVLGHPLEATPKIETSLRRLADRGAVLWDHPEHG